MGKMSDDEKRDWTIMSANPPGEWGDDACMERLCKYGGRIAARYGARDQLDDVVQNVILRMIKNLTWWDNPKNQIGSPAAFKGYMFAAFRNETRSLHRADKRDRENSTSFSALFARRGYDGAVRSSMEPTDPRPAGNPEEVATQYEVLQHLHRILGEFAGTFDKPDDNVDKATYEIFKMQANFSISSREGEEDSVEYLMHLVGLLSNLRPPEEHGLERTGELIEAYMAADPTLTSGRARKRITRLREKFRPFKKRLELVYDILRI